MQMGMERSVSGVVISSWATWTCQTKQQRLWMRMAGCTLETWEDTMNKTFCISQEGSRVSYSSESGRKCTRRHIEVIVVTHLSHFYWLPLATKQLNLFLTKFRNAFLFPRSSTKKSLRYNPVGKHVTKHKSFQTAVMFPAPCSERKVQFWRQKPT